MYSMSVIKAVVFDYFMLLFFIEGRYAHSNKSLVHHTLQGKKVTVKQPVVSSPDRYPFYTQLAFSHFRFNGAGVIDGTVVLWPSPR